MILEILTYIIQSVPSLPVEWLSTEVATAIGTYVATILSIVKYFKGVLEKQRLLHKAEMEKNIEALRKELKWEMDDMKKDICQNKEDIKANRDKTDTAVEVIKTTLNEIAIAIAEIKVAIDKKHS